MKFLSKSSTVVIGGADGPTSVFIAGKLGTGTVILVIGIALLVLIALIILWKKRK